MHRVKLAEDRAFLKTYKSTALLDQKFTCFYCYEPISQRTATIEHVKPKSKGGANSRENIVAACAHCNHTKSSHSVTVFKRLINSSNELPFMLIRFRKTLWIQTHKSCSRIMNSVGSEYDSPIRY